MKKILLLCAALLALAATAEAQNVDTTIVHVVDTVKIERIPPMVNVDTIYTTKNCELMPPTHASKVYPHDPQAPIQPILPGTPANYGIELNDQHELYEDKKE